MSKLIVAYQGAILQSYAADYSRLYRPSAEQETSELLYQSRLIAPFGDIDWFIQIFINLVDNAVKFSANATTRQVDTRYQQLRDGNVQFSVRDYGPGIALDQMKKIFKLFYRSENELTRETVGTGIGLALVQQLASAMRAEVDVVNCDPGAEFRIRLPATGSNPG